MATIAWKEVYETGIVALDNEHRALIESINRLFEAIRDKKCDEVIEGILIMLEKYTVEHFAHEEKLMEQFKFPGLEEHVEKHNELKTAVQNLKNNSSEASDFAKDLLKFLKKWVLDHIVEVDKHYGQYLESRGGRFIS